ncbi:MAG: DNA/RNA non-specific endonuclease [Eubacteriaceae bacterium]|nr:DNA/RNA non-specific endonuclease [Eubacteriaceae bacterium]
MRMSIKKTAALSVMIVCLLFTGCGTGAGSSVSGSSASAAGSSSASASQDTAAVSSVLQEQQQTSSPSRKTFSLKHIPAFKNKPYVTVNGNDPTFTKKQLTAKAYEHYSPLDSEGRCGTAVASIGKELMPTEKRGSIGSVRPTGWHLVKYDIVEGKYLYNRCHLIGYQLTGENANSRNLITGTRYLNVDGMLPFENMVADYIKETGNHVLYRVTPVFKGENLVASGVHMEAESVEDHGKGISFNIYAYDAQPGVKIDYATGDSHLTGKSAGSSDTGGADKNARGTYIINTNTGKFHKPSCYVLSRTKDKNKKKYKGYRKKLIEEGYEPCKICNP